MKSLKFTIVFLLTIQNIFAEKDNVNVYSEIDKKALQLPDSMATTTDNFASYITSNFSTDENKVRAIFIWITTNIQYDTDNMFAINFYEKKEDKISRTLKSRRGICENYATLFTDICIKSGLKSYVIEGYTKQKGIVDFIPHAWSATLIDTSWFLFDPTWGSGYVKSEKFYKKINENFFKASPMVFIKSHIPFDYMWQFLNYPITNLEFYQDKTQENKTKPFFNFMDTIQFYEKQENVEQLISSAYRIEKNGIKNSLVFDRLQHIKFEIEKDKQTKINNLYNSAIIDYQYGINAYNDFIDYKNKQFTPKKTDPEIENILEIAEVKLNEAKNKLAKISNPDNNTSIKIQQQTQAIDNTLNNLKEQQNWLKVYFGKNKSKRKAMFYN